MNGWIKINRSMLEWEHFTEPSVVTVFLALLMTAERDGKTDIKLDELMKYTGMSHNTVNRCIAKLVKSGEITREKKGQNIFTTITNWSKFQGQSLTQKLGECNDLSTQNLGEQEEAIIPKNGSIIHPKNGTIIYNKNNKKDNKNIAVVADARVRTHEEFKADALNDLRVEQGCMAMGITPEQYRQLVAEVTNDWEFRDIPDNEWNLTHLLAQMRIKHNINNRNNGQRTNEVSGQQSDTRAKLNADAVKAMAALAESSRQPEIVPF
jgi:predicted transcriptional regulator